MTAATPPRKEKYFACLLRSQDIVTFTIKVIGLSLSLPLISAAATPLSGRPLGVLGVNCRHVILYNLGLQQLYAGHPTAAFDSLLEVVQVYHTNPRLWLRLAEACIAAQAQVTHTTYSASDFRVARIVTLQLDSFSDSRKL